MGYSARYDRSTGRGYGFCTEREGIRLGMLRSDLTADGDVNDDPWWQMGLSDRECDGPQRVATRAHALQASFGFVLLQDDYDLASYTKGHSFAVRVSVVQVPYWFLAGVTCTLSAWSGILASRRREPL